MAKFLSLLKLNFQALLSAMRVGRKKRSFSAFGCSASAESCHADVKMPATFIKILGTLLDTA